MRIQHIDFCARPVDRRLAGIVLIAGAALLLVAIGLGAWLDAVRPRPKAPAVRAPAARTMPPAESAAIAQARGRIALPWERVFSAIEDATSADVALLEFVPEGARGEVKIVAEARTLAAMLAYQKKLSESPALAQVTVSSHEVVLDSPQRPVRFTLQARWTTS